MTIRTLNPARVSQDIVAVGIMQTYIEEDLKLVIRSLGVSERVERHIIWITLKLLFI